MWTRDPSPPASRRARPPSRAPFFLPPVLGAALAMLLPASTAGAVEGRKVLDVQVKVSLVEPRYRAKLSAGECADVEKGIEDALVAGLSRRFPHVGFGRDVASPWRLEGFVN